MLVIPTVEVVETCLVSLAERKEGGHLGHVVELLSEVEGRESSVSDREGGHIVVSDYN